MNMQTLFSFFGYAFLLVFIITVLLVFSFFALGAVQEEKLDRRIKRHLCVTCGAPGVDMTFITCSYVPMHGLHWCHKQAIPMCETHLLEAHGHVYCKRHYLEQLGMPQDSNARECGDVHHHA